MATPADCGVAACRSRAPHFRFCAASTLLVCALAAFGCIAEDAPEPLPSRLASVAGGCLDLEIGAWAPPTLSVDSIFLGVHQRVFLDTIRDRPTNSSWLPARPVPGTTPSLYSRSRWRRDDEGGLELQWAMEDNGVIVRLSHDGGRLQGRAEYFAHGLSQFPAAATVARPIDCGAPLPAEWANYRRFPLQVELASGDTLAVGTPLPATLEVRAGEYASTVIGERATGVFAGATDLVVALNRAGEIRSVQLVYAAEEFESLIERFSSAWGAPTRDAREDGFDSVQWMGRDSQVDVDRRTTRDGSRSAEVRLSRGLWAYGR
jgi:hypothetical protein